MLHSLLILNIIFQLAVGTKEDDYDDSGPLDGNLATELRNDVNLDLSEDEEYEDLRAEFLAYHTTLASLANSDSRRSMISTPCWRLNGICINYKLCIGYRSLTEVPGCKDKHKVCCFVWNRYNVRDFRDQGIDSLRYPWTEKQEFGGKGVIPKLPVKKKGKKKDQKSLLRSGDNPKKSVAFVLYK